MFSNRTNKHLNLACVILNSLALGISLVTGSGLILMNGLFIGLSAFLTLRYAKLEALEDE